jgi:hypothetical protein
MTFSPAAKAAFAISAPRPRAAPVIIQTFCAIVSSLVEAAAILFYAFAALVLARRQGIRVRLALAFLDLS